MDDLHAAFLPRFLEAARGRLAKALAAAKDPSSGASTATLRDLHSLAGEAGLLGLSSVLARARDCEDKARRLAAARNDDTLADLVGALEELAKALDQLDNHEPTGRTP